MLAIEALARMTIDDFCDAIAAKVAQQAESTTPASEEYDNSEIIGPGEALTFTGKGSTDLWLGVRSGMYPSPVTKPGKARRWRRVDWEDWQQHNGNDRLK